MNTKTNPCKKCGKRYKTLVNVMCFACNPEAWRKHFDKLEGKKR